MTFDRLLAAFALLAVCGATFVGGLNGFKALSDKTQPLPERLSGLAIGFLFCSVAIVLFSIILIEI